MYGLHDYTRMIEDPVRVEAHIRALEATVRPGSVVVELGTGTGLFAIVACRLGARRVFAIDINDAIEVAAELARALGYADQIEFIQGDATKISLPERADVVIGDLRGGMPFAPAHLAVVAHARQNFLAPGGAFIPMRDVLKVAVVASPHRLERALGPAEIAGVDLSAVRARLANIAHRDRSRQISQADLATPPATWGTIDYRTVQPEVLRGHAEWTVEADRVAHGLIIWFDAVLAPSVGFSTEPGRDAVYPQTFLPWTEPVGLRRGDRVSVELWAAPDGDPWGWTTEVRDSAGALKTSFKQSTFLGLPGKFAVPRNAP